MRLKLIGFVGLFAVVLAFWASRNNPESAPLVGGLETGTDGGSRAAVARSPAEVERVEVEQGAAMPEPVAEGVPAAELFGERWADVVAAWNERGFDLEADRRIKPWEDELAELLAGQLFSESNRESTVRSRMKLDSETDELTDDWLFERARIPSSMEGEYDEIARAAARSVASEHHQQMRPIAERYADNLQRIYRDRLQTDRIVRSPFGFVPEDPRLAALVDRQPEGDDPFRVHGGSTGDWFYSLTLDRSDCPELMALLEELNLAIRARDRAIKAALDS